MMTPGRVTLEMVGEEVVLLHWGLAFLCASLVVGCGSVDSKVDAPPAIDGREVDVPPVSDGQVDAPSAIDASGDSGSDAPSPRCNPLRPFTMMQAVSELNDGTDDVTPWLTADELTVMFSSTRPGGAGGYDIYFATRTTPDGTFGMPQLLNGVNTPQADTRPMMTADGLKLFAEHHNGTDYDINVATRASTSVSFSASMPDAMGLNMAGQSDDSQTILPDGRTIYFRSSRDGGGTMHFYTASWTGTSWSMPVRPTGVNLDSTEGEDYPFIAPDDLTLYFMSRRPGGMGSADIWRAHRASVVAGFGAPELVAEVNTADGEVMGWVSADDCVIYFTRSSTGGQEIWRAQRGM